jgi:hypothetical protein
MKATDMFREVGTINDDIIKKAEKYKAPKKKKALWKIITTTAACVAIMLCGSYFGLNCYLSNRGGTVKTEYQSTNGDACAQQPSDEELAVMDKVNGINMAMDQMRTDWYSGAYRSGTDIIVLLCEDTAEHRATVYKKAGTSSIIFKASKYSTVYLGKIFWAIEEDQNKMLLRGMRGKFVSIADNRVVVYLQNKHDVATMKVVQQYDELGGAIEFRVRKNSNVDK